jgi:hypothetical protein
MPRLPVVGHLVADMSTVTAGHRPIGDPARRVPTRKALSARQSPRGTRWCATCNTPLDPEAATTFCAACVSFRDKWAKRQKRLAGEQIVPLHRVHNDEIVDAAEHLEAIMRQLATARGRPKPDPVKVEGLITEMYERALVLTGLIDVNLYLSDDN